MRKRKDRNGGMRRQMLVLPEEIFERGPFIELRGRREICIQGCRKILLCEQDNVRLALRGETMTVRGRDLVCTTYFAGAVSVHGLICRVEFEEGSDGECS